MDQKVSAKTNGSLSGLIDAVARFVPALRFSDLSPEMLRISRRCLLDGLAVMLAGYEQPGMARWSGC